METAKDFLKFSLLSTLLLPPCSTAAPASLEKRTKSFVVVRCFVPDVGVKMKLSEFKSLQVELLQHLAKIATCSKQNMNHICLIRLVVLKRPGFNHANMVYLII